MTERKTPARAARHSGRPETLGSAGVRPSAVPEARTGGLIAQDLIPDVRLTDAALDAFGHREIAARVAEIAMHAETPLNIALFGAWGSGKSSFFGMLSDALDATPGRAKAVRYDAWKYGGESLKRNFLSHCATELGVDPQSKSGRKYSRGLYENVRSVEFDPINLVGNGKFWGYSKLLGFALAVTTAVLLVFALFASALGNDSYAHEVADLAPGLYKFLATALFAIAAGAKLLEGAKVEVEQTVPSEDERFADLFAALVRETTSRGERLVFFVDELDRCSKRDVVATLTSLRTFLDQEGCVFVVAADREVLEEALVELEQATPIREDEPYYSSASAFLDKIFQHQVTLPPLRTGRLTRFARELVADRRGVWEQLREAEPGDQRLNSVLYALIPSHVRSPRRVKVLLNNFATNARVTESRGIVWLDRASEIAKLTVLQTEFPVLAADLLLEPRLPSLLLHPPAALSERQRLLLDRHRLVDSSDDDPKGDAPEDPDRLLVKEPTGALVKRQRDDLLRYLRSREAVGIPDPGRDLLYLEEAGRSTGLDDPELSQLLEDTAADDPTRVVSMLRDRDVADRIAAARFLGYMSDREVGPERVNTMSALAGAVEGLPVEQLTGSLGDLLANVQAYMAEESLVPDQLAGVLAIAVAAGAHGTDTRSVVVAADELTAEDNLPALARMLGDLDDSEALRIERAVGELFAVQPHLLLGGVRDLRPEHANRLLRSASANLCDSMRVASTAPSDPDAIAAAGTSTPAAPSETPASEAGEGWVENAPQLVDQLVDCVQGRDDLAEPTVADIAVRLIGVGGSVRAAIFDRLDSSSEGSRILSPLIGSASAP